MIFATLHLIVMKRITTYVVATRTVGRPIKKYQLKREQMANESSGVGQHWRTVKGEKSVQFNCRIN